MGLGSLFVLFAISNLSGFYVVFEQSEIADLPHIAFSVHLRNLSTCTCTTLWGKKNVKFVDLRKENILDSRCSTRQLVWVYIIQIISAVSKCGYAHVLLYVYVYMVAVAIQCVHVYEERDDT